MRHAPLQRPAAHAPRHAEPEVLWSVVFCASVALLTSACGGSAAGRNDDLGYDPARALVAQTATLNAEGVPVRGDGTPLRAAEVQGEWRTFRGDNTRSGTRVAPGIATPHIVWTAEVGIQGYANTPLVTEDTVFVSSQGSVHNGPDSSDGFYAIDRADGSRRWFYHADEDVNGAMLTDTLVIGGTDSGRLLAIDRDTGTLVWDAHFNAPLRHAPLLFDEMLFVNQSDHLAVIDPATGTEQYRVRTPTDAPWQVRGALAADALRIYRSAQACTLSAHSSDDQEWSAVTCTPSTEEWIVEWNYAPPMLIADRVVSLSPIALAFDDASISLAVTDAATGRVLWQLETEESFDGYTDSAAPPGYDRRHFASVPWVMNGIVWVPLITRPNVVGFDLTTGDPLASIHLPDCRARQFPSIVGVPSRGYFARHDGTLFAFSPLNGEIRWALQMGVNANAGAPLNTAFLGLGGIDTYCQADPWDGTGLFATPAIAEDGTLFVGSGDGYLYAIQDSDWSP